MAPLTFSPDTSISSHTLSAGSGQPSTKSLQPPVADAPSSYLSNPLAFLQPTKQLNASFLAAAKRYLEPVAESVSLSQHERQAGLRARKRKRGHSHDSDIKVLNLKRLQIDGFAVDQVYQQSRKILDATTEEIERSLPNEEEQVVVSQDKTSDSVEEIGVDESSSLGEEGVDWEYDGEDVSDGQDEVFEGEKESADEEQDIEMNEEDGNMFDNEAEDDEAEVYQEDPNKLNDPFFDIDRFNKVTEFLEQADNRGDAVDSEDEEVDWTMDPMAVGSRLGKEDDADNAGSEDEESDEREGGPTFGDADLNAPFGESDEEEELEEGDMDGVDGMGDENANNLMYADFFAPPAQKASKNRKKKGRPNPHNFPSAEDPQNNRPDDDEMDKIMSKVKRDLFEDDSEGSEAEDLSDVDPDDPKARRSNYERRQAKLQEQIRALESENVAKRQWQLSGEASAAARPINSLLEEDLDFERAGKPVVPITSEVSEDIETLIKRRILAGDFDEVRRRRPDDLATGRIRKGQFELEDSKSKKGLGELYEEEFLQKTDPNYVDQRDEKLKKEHAEIATLWTSLSAKLDSLSSSHFKPKPVAPNLEIRVDAPAIEMEDARPTAGGDVAGASMLAPQELYKPGDDQTKSEVVPKSGMPISREEMTREQKLRQRRREKEKGKKAALNQVVRNGGKDGGKGKQNKKEEKRKEQKQVLGDLKKGGVQVIGSKGGVTDVEGREVKDSRGCQRRKGAGSLKL